MGGPEDPPAREGPLPDLDPARQRALQRELRTLRDGVEAQCARAREETRRALLPLPDTPHTRTA